MNFSSLILEPRFSSPLEMKFSMTEISLREREIALMYFKLSLFSSIPPIAVWLLGYMNTPETMVIFSWFTIHTLISGWMVFKNQSTKMLRYVALATMFLAQLSWVIASYIDLADGSGKPALAIVWISYIFLSNLLLPFRAFVHMAMFTYVFLTTSAAIYFYPDNVYGIGATFIALIIGQNAQIISHRAFKLGLISKFREQSRYIPQQVLLQSAREQCSIESVFGPKTRFCVCICSDWRNFQALAGDISPQQLGVQLSAYYERIVERLQKDMPEGNYFMDWIADELFVVMFAPDEKPDATLVDAGFDFGAWLLSHRRRFARVTGYPKGIDVGISSGVASVGIFGPQGSGKATAFGSIPGAARRLQTLAKQFRQEYGDQDRLVLSKASAELIEADRAQCSRIPVKDSYSIKDLTDTHVFLWPKVQSIHLVEREKKAS